MNSEVKRDWQGALRSGDYPQDTGSLRTPGGWCCLGVLCDRAVQAGIIPAPGVDNGAYFYDGQRYYLPAAVQEWAGLNDHNPSVRVRDESVLRPLGYLNDHHVPFDEIADLIDENF
jgi:hypothetical protein